MNKLDEVIAAIRNEEPVDDAVEKAASRVRSRLFAHSAAAPDRIRGCADYQALIPLYLNRNLSAARSLLLQDHTRECVNCRHALNAARAAGGPTIIRPVTPPSHTIPKFWAIAAMALIVLGSSTWFVARNFLGGSGRTTVQAVNGILYAVSDRGSTPIFSGRDIHAGEHVRTAKGSTATLRLGDGSVVELNERTELTVSYASTGATVKLDRGDVIVQAAKQRRGTLDVLTPDCLVSVKGTVFAVNRGIKGSRVSVIEGSVKVAQGAQSQMLKPGDQVSTDPSVGKVPIRNTVEWSQQSAKYAALLAEFAGIQKKLEEMPSPGLRYDAKLLKYIPGDAVLYAAMPNIGATVAEANRLLRERLQDNEVLRTWWDEQNNGVKVDTVLRDVQALSSYLGDEVVMTISGDWEGNYTPPMILAEVKKPGLRGYLETELRKLSSGQEGDMPEIVDIKRVDTDSGMYARRRARVSRNGSEGPMRIAINDNLMVVAFNQQQINDVADRLEGRSVNVGGHGIAATVENAYKNGTNWLLCVDMEQIARNVVQKHGGRDKMMATATGLESMRYLVVERKDLGGSTINQATLDFSGRRGGLSAWLAEPAALGTLDFVSPDATLAVSMALREPGWMLNDVMRQFRADDPEFDQRMDNVYRETGVRLSDVAGALGGEFTFALDGSLLPLPAWKFAIEVYDPARLQLSLERFIEAYNTHSQCDDCKITVTKQDSNARAFYAISSKRIPYEIYYTYVDGYLVAAPEMNLLNRAIQNRATGYVLSRSEAFRSQLPQDGRMNFSALIYHNLGPAVQPLAKQLGSTTAVTPEQRANINSMVANAVPGLIYAYAENSRITVASRGTFFGMSLTNFALPQLLGKTGFKTGPRTADVAPRGKFAPKKLRPLFQ